MKDVVFTKCDDNDVDNDDNKTQDEDEDEDKNTVLKEIEVPGGLYVAIKRVVQTTSAHRVLTEAMLLKRLGEHPYISTVHFIEIDRDSGQISLVLPYVPHSSFKSYFMNMSVTEIQLYMYALFSAIAHLERYVL